MAWWSSSGPRRGRICRSPVRASCAASPRRSWRASRRERWSDEARGDGGRRRGAATGAGGQAMTLASLLAEVETTAVTGPTDREISDLCLDSRRVAPGAVFFGLAGAREDGGRYAAQAVAAGAAAVVVARGTTVAGTTVVEVEEPRRALAQAAARFHGHPERALRVIGVTGTNGKTTTTWMLEAIFAAAGLKAGVIGTT